MKPFLLVLVAMFVLVPGVMATSDNVSIVMTNTRLFHLVDYGVDSARLTTYNMTSSVDLAAVQDWILYGSGDGIGWTLLDSQDDVSFTHNISQTFFIGSPDVYRYYDFYFSQGFYQVGEFVTLTLNTTQVTVSPWPIIAPRLSSPVEKFLDWIGKII